MYLLANPRRDSTLSLLKKREKGKICSDVRTEACAFDCFRIIISGVFTPVRRHQAKRTWT